MYLHTVLMIGSIKLKKKRLLLSMVHPFILEAYNVTVCAPNGLGDHNKGYFLIQLRIYNNNNSDTKINVNYTVNCMKLQFKRIIEWIFIRLFRIEHINIILCKHCLQSK